MILRSKNPVFGGWNGRATILKRLPDSSHGKPMLVIDGEPISPTETELADLEVVKASARELELLKLGGYIN
jgi:hypothetical protein